MMKYAQDGFIICRGTSWHICMGCCQNMAKISVKLGKYTILVEMLSIMMIHLRPFCKIADIACSKTHILSPVLRLTIRQILNYPYGVVSMCRSIAMRHRLSVSLQQLSEPDQIAMLR